MISCLKCHYSKFNIKCRSHRLYKIDNWPINKSKLFPHTIGSASPVFVDNRVKYFYYPHEEFTCILL